MPENIGKTREIWASLSAVLPGGGRDNILQLGTLNVPYSGQILSFRRLNLCYQKDLVGRKETASEKKADCHRIDLPHEVKSRIMHMVVA